MKHTVRWVLRDGSRVESAPRRPGPGPLSAFTLVELLTVIAIIAILTGLVIGLFKVASTKQTESRARAEIKALELAIEAYKLDKGVYPISTNLPRSSGLQATLNSIVLYEALSGNAAGTGLSPDSTNRAYFTAFSSAKNGNLSTSNGQYYIVSPTRDPYNYINFNSGTGLTNQNNKASFDLWFFGIDGVNNEGTNDDITNWRS